MGPCFEPDCGNCSGSLRVRRHTFHNSCSHPFRFRSTHCIPVAFRPSCYVSAACSGAHANLYSVPCCRRNTGANSDCCISPASYPLSIVILQSVLWAEVHIRGRAHPHARALRSETLDACTPLSLPSPTPVPVNWPLPTRTPASTPRTCELSGEYTLSVRCWQHDRMGPGGRRKPGVNTFLDPAMAARISAFPWVADGVTAWESSAILVFDTLAREDYAFGEAVLDLWWIPNDMPSVEAVALQDIGGLARGNLSMAWQAIGAWQAISQPFLEPPFRQRDQYALNSLRWLAWDPPGTTMGSDRYELLSR